MAEHREYGRTTAEEHYAAQAGKDIYCEKPLAVCIGQGRAMVEAVREHQVVFQTGSQQRTEFGGLFRDACELVRNGRIGQVKTIRVGVGPPPVPCDLPEEPVPKGTDWNLWLGPAPWRGYNEVLCPQGVHHHFPAWKRNKTPMLCARTRARRTRFCGGIVEHGAVSPT